MTDDEKTVWQKLSLPAAKERDLFIQVVVRGGREEVGVLDSLPIEQVTAVVTELAQLVGDALEKARPSKATVEVGLEFGLQEGKLVALIARGSGKANLKIGLEWARSPSQS